jgi:coenzyme F420-reducing hydrogenase gamma subunit
VSEKLRLGVFKFASCDGCQLQVLNLERELLALSERLEIAHFLEASSRVAPGPYDVALVEGSITTKDDVARIRRIREQSRVLVTIGACATAGGIQALRNWCDGEAIEEWKRHVYPDPRWVAALPTSTPIADHVAVDYEIHGCPIDRQQLLRVLLGALRGATPDLPGHSVCLECKRRGLVCVLVARGVPCMGPVTRTGCGALCPAHRRDCYACFGPMEQPNTEALARRFEDLGLDPRDVQRRFRGICGWQGPFRAASERGEGGA